MSLSLPKLHLAPWLHSLLSSLGVAFVYAVYGAVAAADPKQVLSLVTWDGALHVGLGVVVIKFLGWGLAKLTSLDPPVVPVTAIGGTAGIQGGQSAAPTP